MRQFDLGSSLDRVHGTEVTDTNLFATEPWRLGVGKPATALSIHCAYSLAIISRATRDGTRSSRRPETVASCSFFLSILPPCALRFVVKKTCSVIIELEPGSFAASDILPIPFPLECAAEASRRSGSCAIPHKHRSVEVNSRVYHVFQSVSVTSR